MDPSAASSIGDVIRKAAEEILRRSGETGFAVAPALIEVLRPLLVWPYQVGRVLVSDVRDPNQAGLKVAVYTSNKSETLDAPMVPATNIAAAFYCTDVLTVQELRKGYERIGVVKRIEHSSPSAPGTPMNDATLGIIFCIDSEDSLDNVAEAVIGINKEFPSREWPDAVVILKKGAVNYAVQFEGDKIKGDFLLPTITDFPVMPMYVHVVARATGLRSLNWLCGFLFMHLEIFSPGVMLPKRDEVAGPSSTVMNFGGYQFNLQCQLVPVPDEMQSEKGAGLRNLPFRIESQKGELLSHVQFIPWQEGGVIRIVGKLPIEPILMFLGRTVMKGAHIIQQANGRISSALPISRNDFLKALRRFQAQSNMIVKPEQPSWIVSKMGDEGSSSPFIARLYIGVLEIRDRVFDEVKRRNAFDKAYESAMTALSDARATAKQIHDLVHSHISKVATGEAARLRGKAIHVDGIDKELRKHTADFLTSAGRSLKQGMQSVAKDLGLEIGFFFKDAKQFHKGLQKLSATDPDLADYLREARNWAERLNGMRNKLEHEGWTLPRVGYRENSGKIEIVEPEVEGEPVTRFVDSILDRLCCFVEEVTMYGLTRQLDPAIAVAEVPRTERDAAIPKRFRPTLAMGGVPIWKLDYHLNRFDEV